MREQVAAAIKERDEARAVSVSIHSENAPTSPETVAALADVVNAARSYHSDMLDRDSHERAARARMDRDAALYRATRLASALREACIEWESLVREFETQRKDRHTEANTRTIAALRAIADGGAL